MKSFLAAIVVCALVVIGLGMFSKTTVTVQSPEKPVGAVSSPDSYYYSQYFAGLGSQFFKTLTSGSSSSSPAALSSAASGFFTVAASASTASASSSLITATTDKVFLTQVTSVPTAGTTCNTAKASGTTVSLVVVATSTNNGFITNVQPAPVTNPYCYSYLIVK